MAEAQPTRADLVSHRPGQYWEKREVPAGPQPYAVERILAALKEKGIETFADPHPGVRLVA